MKRKTHKCKKQTVSKYTVKRLDYENSKAWYLSYWDSRGGHGNSIQISYCPFCGKEL